MSVAGPYSSFSSDSGMFAVRGQCDHGRSSHGILHTSPPAHLNFLHENINVDAPGLLGSGQRSSCSGSDEDRSSNSDDEIFSLESPCPHLGPVTWSTSGPHNPPVRNHPSK